MQTKRTFLNPFFALKNATFLRWPKVVRRIVIADELCGNPSVGIDVLKMANRSLSNCDIADVQFYLSGLPSHFWTSAGAV